MARSGHWRETQGARPDYPIIADTDLKVSKLYGMLEADAEGDAVSRCAMDNRTVRGVFVIDPARRHRFARTGRLHAAGAAVPIGPFSDESGTHAPGRGRGA